jgi:zinc protease
MPKLLFAFLLIFTPLLTAFGQEATDISPRPWPFEAGDIPVDPRGHFGHLDNGLRWVWVDNATPKYRSYLRLIVDVGSFAEEEHELGMAHFVEHMAFNGIEGWPGNSLTSVLQKLGMEFGADQNASTGFFKTIYKLNMPNSESELMELGLTILRGYADKIIFDKDEVEKEKGVIDSEDLDRSGASKRGKDIVASTYPNPLLAQRFPIGTKEVRSSFSAEGLRNFYERWYRPELMTVVIVGDLEGNDPEEMIERIFGSMRGEGELPSMPSAGPVISEDKFFTVLDKDSSTGRIELSRLQPSRSLWNSSLGGGFWTTINTALANFFLFRPFTENTSTPALSIRHAEWSDLAELHMGEMLTISSPPEDWRISLQQSVEQLRAAFINPGLGLSDMKLRELLQTSIDSHYAGMETEDSRRILSKIIDFLDNPNELRFVDPAWSISQVEDRYSSESGVGQFVMNSYARQWNDGVWCISYVGPNQVDANDLREAFTSAWNKPLSLKEAASAEQFEWAYGSSGNEPGVIISREKDAELEFEKVVFENGVEVYLKETEFKQGEMGITVSLGSGFDYHEGKGVSLMRYLIRNGISANFFQMGTKRHTSQDISRNCSSVGGFGIKTALRSDSLSLTFTRSSLADTLLLFEIIVATILDNGWSSDFLESKKKYLPIIGKNDESSPIGPYKNKFLPAVHNNDNRVVMPSLKELESAGITDVRNDFEQLFKHGDLGLAIVGDIDIEETISALAVTFGAMPQRSPRQFLDDINPLPMATGVWQEHTIETESDGATLIVSWPLPGNHSANASSQNDFLASHVEGRLRTEIRERTGSTYSPSVSVESNSFMKDWGWLTLDLTVDPQDAGEVAEACLGVLHGMGGSDEQVDFSKMEGVWLVDGGENSGEIKKINAIGEDEVFLRVRITEVSSNRIEGKGLCQQSGKVLFALPSDCAHDRYIEIEFDAEDHAIGKLFHDEEVEENYDFRRIGANPSASKNSSNDADPDEDVFVLESEGDSSVKQGAASEIEVSGELVEAIDEEEVSRLRAPELKKQRDSFLSNSSWLYFLTHCYTIKDHLSNFRKAENSINSISALELTNICRQFLRKHQANVLIVRPAGWDVK